MHHPRRRACSLVGRFLYHFGRVEQKIDQAIIKLLDIDEKVAPAVTGGIDFAKKVNLVENCAKEQANNPGDEEFADNACNEVFKINDDRQIVAHSSFEPASDGGVRFKRTVSKDGRVRPRDWGWTDSKFFEQYRKMSALESQLDRLIQLIKPTEIPLDWFVPWQHVYHRSSLAAVMAATTGIWPPNNLSLALEALCIPL
jgi:hypothetical protein